MVCSLFLHHLADNDAISVPIVRAAARQWYLRDKERAATANPDAQALLYWIIDEVIANRQAKAFLLRQGIEERHALIQSLYDDRVIHIVKKGVATNDQPGARYNVYSLDYGCYVELISTTRAPLGLFEADEEDGEIYVQVPRNDYRSIRRAILDLSAFEAA